MHPLPANKYIHPCNAFNGSIFRSPSPETICEGTLGTQTDCHQPVTFPANNSAGQQLARTQIASYTSSCRPCRFSMRGNLLKLFAHINQPPRHSGPATSSFLMWNLSVLVQASKSGPLRKKDTLLKYSNSLNYRRATPPGTSHGTNSTASGAPGQLGACGGNHVTREPPSAVVLDAVSLEVRVKYKVKGRMEAVDRGGPRVVDFMALLKQVHRTSQSPDISKFQSSPFLCMCLLWRKSLGII